MCVTERKAIFKELAAVAASLRECLWSRILESSPKLSKILAKEALQENICHEAPINDQNLVPVKGFVFW